jgi:hypothetical protein
MWKRFGTPEPCYRGWGVGQEMPRYNYDKEMASITPACSKKLAYDPTLRYGRGYGDGDALNLIDIMHNVPRNPLPRCFWNVKLIKLTASLYPHSPPNQHGVQ